MGSNGTCAFLTATGSSRVLFCVLFSFSSRVCVCSNHPTAAMCKCVTCQSAAPPDKPSCPKLRVPMCPGPRSCPLLLQLMGRSLRALPVPAAPQHGAATGCVCSQLSAEGCRLLVSPMDTDPPLPLLPPPLAPPLGRPCLCPPPA